MNKADLLKWVEQLDDPDRYKIWTGLAGELQNIGGVSALACSLMLPLIDLARNVDRIATALEEANK